MQRDEDTSSNNNTFDTIMTGWATTQGVFKANAFFFIHIITRVVTYELNEPSYIMWIVLITFF